MDRREFLSALGSLAVVSLLPTSATTVCSEERHYLRVIAGLTPGYPFLYAYLDGKRLDHCVIADELDRYALCFRTDDQGEVLTDEYGAILHQLYHGQVEIRLRPGDPNHPAYQEARRFLLSGGHLGELDTDGHWNKY